MPKINIPLCEWNKTKYQCMNPGKHMIPLVGYDYAIHLCTYHYNKLKGEKAVQ